MKKLTALIATLTLTLSACTPPTPIYRNPLPPSTVSASDITKAKQVAASQMKDPSSVQFRNIAGYSLEGGTILCGEINGKNSFGGYVGYKHFTSVAGHLLLDISTAPGDPLERHFNSNWNNTCKPH